MEIAEVLDDGSVQSIEYDDDDKDEQEADDDFEPKPERFIQYKSWVWHYGKLTIDYRDGKRRARWHCNKCLKNGTPQSFVAHSSTWILKHLRDEHEILKPRFIRPICPALLDGTTIMDGMTTSKRRRDGDLAKFRRDMTMWMCVSRQAFLVVEEPLFKEMIADLSWNAASMLPKCSDTIRSWIVSEFKQQKAHILEHLRKARSRIHLSMDIWTTPSGDRCYLGIVANWCDNDDEIRNVLIALPPIEGQHNGENIAAIAFKVIEEYGIGRLVGYCMLDGASNNDTGVTELHALLVANYDEQAIPLGERRLHCSGHVYNLATKALIFGSDVEAFEFPVTNLDDEKDMEEEFRRWRKAGSIGKTHNFVVFILRSPQRRQSFRSIQTNVLKWSHSIVPRVDNATRWSSVFLMINDVLNLREPIELYLSMCRTSKTMEKKDKQRLESHCSLADDDWEELIHIHGLLYHFWELTIRMQGNVAKKMREAAIDQTEIQQGVYGKPGELLFGKFATNPITTTMVETTEDGALFNVLPAFDHLLSRLEMAKETYANNPRLATCVNLAWKKLKEYYMETDFSKVYLVAAVLDPRVKLRYFEQNWEPEWLVGIRDKLDSYIEEFSRAIEVHDYIVPNPDGVHMNESQDSNTTFGSWRKSDEDEGLTGLAKEWERCLESARVKDYKGFSVRRWWIVQRDQLPVLSQVALETLAIPAMSTEVERTFSGYIHIMSSPLIIGRS